MGRPIKKSIVTVLYIHPQTGGTRLITAQKGSRRYKCANNGNTVFRLVADSTPAVGEAYMLAYDSDGNTYYVIKLTAHHATLVRKEQVGVPAFQFATGSAIKWNKFASAIANQTVQIENDD